MLHYGREVLTVAIYKCKEPLHRSRSVYNAAVLTALIVHLQYCSSGGAYLCNFGGFPRDLAVPRQGKSGFLITIGRTRSPVRTLEKKDGWLMS